ncbi:hypothetical protein DFS21_11090 [Pseudomonas sp. 2848]|uniref:hypothetical protein n=1 Tax=Pseudomonas sp. 2848 TaxID=2183926 RepID=UPI000DB5A182|nr:hypothetical protein [Pseudomonas sp. 2848]PZW76638.1 hypothetical protein DFS21_11090 [Pseudomonas sp. 2848]
MPTENRSSNTEMVSVPKERAELLINLLAEVARTAHWLADNSEDCGDEGIDCQRVDFESLSDALDKCEELPELPDSPYVRDGWLRAADELRALLAQPAEQHQGEYPPCDYCGTVPDYHPWHGSGMIKGVESIHIHACDGCRSQLPAHPEQHQGEPAKHTNRLCHIDYTAHPYRCGCLKGDEEAQRIYDEHCSVVSDEPSAKQAFRDYCDSCAEKVATWPAWKRESIKSPPVPAVVCRPGINCGKCWGCTSRARGKQP